MRYYVCIYVCIWVDTGSGHTVNVLCGSDYKTPGTYPDSALTVQLEYLQSLYTL